MSLEIGLMVLRVFEMWMIEIIFVELLMSFFVCFMLRWLLLLMWM